MQELHGNKHTYRHHTLTRVRVYHGYHKFMRDASSLTRRIAPEELSGLLGLLGLFTLG